MLTKQTLLEHIQNEYAKHKGVIRLLTGHSKEIKTLKKYILALGSKNKDEPLTLLEIYKIKNYLDKTKNRLDTQSATQKTYNSLEDFIATELIIIINKFRQKTWFYKRANQYVGAFNEIFGLGSEEMLGQIENVLAVIFLASSIYAFSSPNTMAKVIAAKFSQIISAFFVSILINQSVNEQSKIVSGIRWAFGFGLQASLGFITGSSYLLIGSYIGGTLFEKLTRILMDHASTTKNLTLWRRRYPLCYNLLNGAIEDTSFTLGAWLGGSFMEYGLSDKKDENIKKTVKKKRTLPRQQPGYSSTPQTEQKKIPQEQPRYETSPKKKRTLPRQQPGYSSTPPAKKKKVIQPYSNSSNQDCTIPIRDLGSAQDSCTVEGKPYVSNTDPNLKNIAFCEFKIDCKTLDGTYNPHTLFAPRELKDCFSQLENCDGELRPRGSGDRICTDTETIKWESKKGSTSRLTDQSCELPNGSYKKTCNIVKSRRYNSEDTNLADSNLCIYDMDCKTLAGKMNRQRFILPSSLRGCIRFFENCNGSLVPRRGESDNYCGFRQN